MSEICDRQNIVDSLEAIDNNEDKLNYVSLILNQCGKGGASPEHIVKWQEWMMSDKTKPKPLPTTSKAMNEWICYLKTCAKTNKDLTYLDCVKDKSRANREYYPKKEFWKQEALKGCPNG